MLRLNIIIMVATGNKIIMDQGKEKIRMRELQNSQRKTAGSQTAGEMGRWNETQTNRQAVSETDIL